MKTRSTILLSLLWAAFGLTACVEGEMEGGGGMTPYDLLSVDIPTGVIPLVATDPIDTQSPVSKASIPLQPQDSAAQSVLSIPSVADTLPPPATRAEDDVVYPRAIVLQYSATGGALLNSGSTNIDNYAIGSSISASLMESESCNIYVLVVNEKITTGASDDFSTEEKLKAASYALYTRFSSPTDKDIPLLGSLSGVRINRMPVSDGSEKGLILNTDGKPVKVELRRIAAKLAVSFTYEAAGFTAGEQGTIADIPSAFLYMEGTGNYPAASSTFINKEFTISDRDGDHNNASKTNIVIYVPDNRRGIVEEILRPFDKIAGKAPEKSTYLTFSAIEKKSSSHQLIYRFYFGGNNTSDFNIRRNYVYTLSSAISQTADGDPRVTESGRMPEVWLDPLVTEITETKATLRGKVMRNGATVTAVSIGFKKQGDTNMTWRTCSLQDQDVATYALTESSLSSNTVYQYAIKMTATVGGVSQTVESAPLSFSTNTTGMPVLTKEVAPTSGATGLSASASGNTATGEGITEKGIVYSTEANFDPLQSGTRVKATGTDATFSVSLTGLTKATNYYYRYYAKNAQGITYSSANSTFRTKDTPSEPTGGEVTSTVVNQLTFSATLPDRKNTVDDYPTAAGVRYWTTDPGTDLTSGGTTISFSELNTPGKKSVNLLRAEEDYSAPKYWYSFYSTNGVGTEYSGKQEFTLSAYLPDVKPSKERTTGPQQDELSVTTERNTKATFTGSGVSSVSGDGTPFHTVSMTANTTGSSRVAYVTFTTINELPLRSATYTVTQRKVVFPASFEDVIGVNVSGQKATPVPVTSNIPWKATSDKAWCTISDGSQNGTNSPDGSTDYFSYTVAKNTGAARKATITVEGISGFDGTSKTFTVNQEGGYQGSLTPNDPNINDQTTKFE